MHHNTEQQQYFAWYLIYDLIRRSYLYVSLFSSVMVFYFCIVWHEYNNFSYLPWYLENQI